MGGYGAFVGLLILLPACTSHHYHHTTPRLDPEAYFHEISRLWKVGNERVFSW